MKTLNQYKQEFRTRNKTGVMPTAKPAESQLIEMVKNALFSEKIEQVIERVVYESLVGILSEKDVLGTLAKEASKLVADGKDGRDGADGKDGWEPTKEELIAVIKPLIPRVKDGRTPSEAELRAIIKPLIPKPAKDGRTPIAGVDFPLPKDGSPDTPEDIAVKINTLDEKIEPTAIRGWKNLMRKINDGKKKIFVRGGGSGGGSAVMVVDLSASLDGVTNTFTIPSNSRILSVHFSSFPFSASRPTVDYTSTATSITFTSEIDAATTLAAGQSCLVEYVEA